MTDLPFAATTPISIGRVGLRSRDANRLADYYKSVLGLQELRKAGREIGLGIDGREILAIEESSSLRDSDPRSAGLYHTAFLLPRRSDLARWTQHAIDTGVAVDGASDHFVSEALYLTDPDGNGVEIYADRDRSQWTFDEGRLSMGTEPLNFESLKSEIEAGEAGWSGAPENTVVGHVHLRVGDTRTAEQWWNEQGFDTMVNYGSQAVFLSSGGYHHHIGANSWQSRGAGPREDDMTGLAFVELRSTISSSSHETADPWGNLIRTISL